MAERRLRSHSEAGQGARRRDRPGGVVRSAARVSRRVLREGPREARVQPSQRLVLGRVPRVRLRRVREESRARVPVHDRLAERPDEARRAQVRQGEARRGTDQTRSRVGGDDAEIHAGVEALEQPQVHDARAVRRRGRQRARAGRGDSRVLPAVRHGDGGEDVEPTHRGSDAVRRADGKRVRERGMGALARDAARPDGLRPARQAISEGRELMEGLPRRRAHARARGAEAAAGGDGGRLRAREEAAQDVDAGRCVLYTSPHTTPFARWTPILKDFSRRISPPTPRFQSPSSTPFNAN